MKIQIKRFSPHQNAKVFAVLMALSSLVFIVPLVLLLSLVPTAEGHKGPGVLVFLLLPIMYLVMGYIMTAIGCLLYNFVTKYTGGMEYEANREEA